MVKLTARFLRAVLALVLFVPAQSGPAAVGEMFASESVWSIRFEIPASGLESLRRDSRTYVPATLREGTNILREAGVRLKGRTGSFRRLDDKPAFTISCDQFVPGQRFRGLSKFHLNNSVEDPSCLNEKLGGELFRAAGVPAPRVGHALVELNGRRLGLYVLKEGFSEGFLARHFERAQGALYDPGAGGDITSLPRREGSRALGDAALQRLASAAQDPDATNRWRQLSGVLDLDRFLSFMAMEVLIGHRDGYCLARNNYRLYHDPASDKFVFLPAGMDQLFGRTDLPVRPHMAGLVARGVMETPEGRQACRQRMQALLTNVLQVASLTNRVRQDASRLATVLPRDEARALQHAAADLCERIRGRVLEAGRQLAAPEQEPLRFENGVGRPGGWRALDEPVGGRLDHAPAPDGRAALHLLAGPTTSASWRAKVLLAPGRYRFEGQARTAGVKPLAFGKNHGASLGVVGTKTSRPQLLAGETGWTSVEVEFELRGHESEVDLVCALRASAGEAWFDAASLRLVRTKGNPD
ncbi:MAG TPA: CotH kinase family protein [Verrucomicrobiae bacterium]|nr:CotH kinase family protein [Verrucomicrobiae bacterium]